MAPAELASGGGVMVFRGSPYTLGPLIPVGAGPHPSIQPKCSLFMRLFHSKGDGFLQRGIASCGRPGLV